MPKLKYRSPSYRLHKPPGQAVVTINGKDHYLGPHSSDESDVEYKRLMAESTAVQAAPCRVGGGVRSVQDVRDWIKRGAAQVVVGTQATPGFLCQLLREWMIAGHDERDRVYLPASTLIHRGARLGVARCGIWQRHVRLHRPGGWTRRQPSAQPAHVRSPIGGGCLRSAGLRLFTPTEM